MTPILGGSPSFHRRQGLLVLALLLGTTSFLQAGIPPSAEPPSALMRWWNHLARHRVQVQTDEQGTLITESGWGGHDRTYQRARDAEGRTRESYWEKGQAKPVDENVRRWVDATLLGAHQQPPAPPDPPAPPTPPVPPPPPIFRAGEAGQAALNQVQNDPRLLALVGSPISLDPKAKGSLTTWAPGEPHGWHLFSPTGGAKAVLTLFLSGPRGGALLHVVGERKGSTWTFSRLEAQSNQGGPQVNLLSR